jgi:excisionase family DNA binding protein
MPLDVATPDLVRPPAIMRSPFRMGTLAIYQREGGTLDIQPPAPRRSPVVRTPPLPALPLPVRRFLSISEAAEYVGVSVQTFREEVAEGRWPGPVRRGRTARAVTWDVRALDRAADAMAGIAARETAAGGESAAEAAERAAMETFKHHGSPEINRPQHRAAARRVG